MKHLCTAFVLLLSLSIPAFAGETDSEFIVSITFSPFRLLNPELFLTGELKMTPKVSVALMMGAGRITDEGKTHSIYEASGQFRYYPIGSFRHGMMIGADAGYVHAGGDQMASASEHLVGIHAGGFLGYKLVTKRGFTSEFQIGPVYLWGKTKETTELQTLINLNVGWSFNK